MHEEQAGGPPPTGPRPVPARWAARGGRLLAGGAVVLFALSGSGPLPAGRSAAMAALPVDRSPIGATGALPATPLLLAPPPPVTPGGLAPATAGAPARTGGGAAPRDAGGVAAGSAAATAVAATYTERGIPSRVLAAYRQAEAAMAGSAAGCHLHWWVIAGIGRIESSHAEGGRLDARGDAVPAILGPVLDGRPGTAAVGDSDGGRLDGDTSSDRAVGPMQFLPSTWQVYGAGGDPENVADAALGTARYLCAGAVDLAVPEQLSQAVFRYNHSDAYVANVLGWSRAYRLGVSTSLDVPTAAATGSGLHAAGRTTDAPLLAALTGSTPGPTAGIRLTPGTRPARARAGAHTPSHRPSRRPARSVPTAVGHTGVGAGRAPTAGPGPATPGPSTPGPATPGPSTGTTATPTSPAGTPTTPTPGCQASVPGAASSAPAAGASPLASTGTASPTAGPATASPAPTGTASPTRPALVLRGEVTSVKGDKLRMAVAGHGRVTVDLSHIHHRPKVGDQVQVMGTPSAAGDVLLARSITAWVC